MCWVSLHIHQLGSPQEMIVYLSTSEQIPVKVVGQIAHDSLTTKEAGSKNWRSSLNVFACIWM